MTIVNGIEIDHMKDAIVNNEPIEDKLNVIIVISNPCEYARRYILQYFSEINEDEWYF